jgi:hypothetical protein
MNTIEPKFSINKFTRESVEFFIQIIKTVFLGIKNYWKVILITWIVLGLIYFFNSRNTEDFYEAKASFTFNYVHKKVYGDMFFYLQELVEQKNVETLSEALNIPIEIAQGIRKIEARNIVNSPLHQDFTFERIPFYLYLDCQNKEDIPRIQKALVNYILNDTANKSVAQKEINDYRATLTFVKSDLAMIDSLLQSKKQRDTTSTIELLNLAKERQKEKISLENRLSDLNTISVLSDFRPKLVQKEKQNWILLKKHMFIALFFSFLLVTFLQWYNSPLDEF